MHSEANAFGSRGGDEISPRRHGPRQALTIRGPCFTLIPLHSPLVTPESFADIQVAAHGQRRNHKQLVRKQPGQSTVRAVPDQLRPLIRKRADGSKCRVRPTQAAAAPAPDATGNTETTVAVSDGDNANSGNSPFRNQDSSAPAPTDSQSTAPTDNAQPQGQQPQAEQPQSEQPHEEQPSSTDVAPAPTAAPPSNPPGNSYVSNNKGKFGLSWVYLDDNFDYQPALSPVNYIGTQTSWYYTWRAQSSGPLNRAGVEYVPMLWGKAHISDWYSRMGSWPDIKNALFFNEPEIGDQAGIGAADSVYHWINDFHNVLAPKGVRRGGAATSSSPTGLVWIQDFVKACTDQGHSSEDCTPDFWPSHYYDTAFDDIPSGQGYNIVGFKSYMENYHAKAPGNKPLWVTEYACQNYRGGAQCSPDQTWAFHSAAAKWMDSQDWIERYSPYGESRLLLIY